MRSLALERRGGVGQQALSRVPAHTLCTGGGGTAVPLWDPLSQGEDSPRSHHVLPSLCGQQHLLL